MPLRATLSVTFREYKTLQEQLKELKLASADHTKRHVVVQGETDAFGRPEDVAAVLSGRPGASVYAVPGDHALRKDVAVVAAAAVCWLDDLVPSAGRG